MKKNISTVTPDEMIRNLGKSPVDNEWKKLWTEVKGLFYNVIKLLFLLILTALVFWLGYVHGLRPLFSWLPAMSFFQAMMIRFMVWGIYK